MLGTILRCVSDTSSSLLRVKTERAFATTLAVLWLSEKLIIVRSKPSRGLFVIRNACTKQFYRTEESLRVYFPANLKELASVLLQE